MRIEQLLGKKILERAHAFDAGADVFFTEAVVLEPGQFKVVEIDAAVKIPPGLVGWVVPRSSAAAKGLFMSNVPVDAGYTGKLHAFVFNAGEHKITVSKKKSIAQLVIQQAIMTEFRKDYLVSDRGVSWAGSTGNSV